MSFWINKLVYFFLILFITSLKGSPFWEYSAIVPIPTDVNGVMSEEKIVGIPTVKDVSAMCSAVGGIHASIEFDRPFSGRIYSLGFGNVHECIYFNGYHATKILFSISADNCGTRLTRSTRKVVDMIENRVYVQMDKFTLTSFDRKFAFVCELSTATNSVGSPFESNSQAREIRRRPISPMNGLWDNDIQSVTAITPIIPQNAPKETKSIMPAILLYGNQQWKIPPENINFKQINNSSPFDKFGQVNKEKPTIIIPLAENTKVETETDKFFSASSTQFTTLHESNKPIIEDSSMNLQDSDLLQTIATPSTTNWPKFLENSLTSDKSTLFSEMTTIVPLFKSMPTAFPYGEQGITGFSTPLIILPFANQKLPETALAKTTFIAGSSSPTNSSDTDNSIYLEIKRGAETPEKSSRIDGTVRIGEPIMLVVHAKSISHDPNQFNIFVHSCYSSGGTEATRIRLIDSSGCAVHPQVIGGMKRERVPLSLESSEKFNAEIVYYFAMRAFKFPTGDDVHFFCSVDISPDYNFPALCSPLTLRKARKVPLINGSFEPLIEMRKKTLDSNQKQMMTIHELRVSNLTFVADESLQFPSFEQVKGITEMDNNSIEYVNWPSTSLLLSAVIFSILLVFATIAIIYLSLRRNLSISKTCVNRHA